MNLERERNGLPLRVLRSRRLADAKEAARLERWINRPRTIADPTPIPRIRKKPVRKTTPETLMDRLVEEFRRSLVETVIASKGGNKCKAAKVLGVHRNTINRIVGSKVSA